MANQKSIDHNILYKYRSAFKILPTLPNVSLIAKDYCTWQYVYKLDIFQCLIVKPFSLTF